MGWVVASSGRRPYREQAPGQERGQTAPPGRNTDGRRPDEEGRVW